MPASARRSANQPQPKVGRLPLAEDPQELVASGRHLPIREHRSAVVEHRHLRALAVKVDSDEDHDWASFLSRLL